MSYGCCEDLDNFHEEDFGIWHTSQLADQEWFDTRGDEEPEKPRWYLIHDMGAGGREEISFCPFCGGKLP